VDREIKKFQPLIQTIEMEDHGLLFLSPSPLFEPVTDGANNFKERNMKKLAVLLASLVLLAVNGNVQAQSSGRLSGAFVYFGYSGTDEVIPVTQMPAFLDELQDLGNDTVIVSQTRATRSGYACATSASQFEWIKGFPDKLGALLDAAQVRGMKVYVGTTFSSKNCPTFWGSTNTAVVEADVRQNLSLLSSRYGSHPAFAGWYIPDEPGIPNSDKYDFYRRETAALKALTPGKPVALSPYFPNQPTLPSPTTLAWVASAFRNSTGVDIQIWQDGIGAIPGTKLFHWTRAGYSSEAYYQALAGALGTNGLWADIELFNYGKPLLNSVNGALTGSYRSASPQRINQQLWSARFAGKRVSWLHQWHMSEVVGPTYGYVEAPLQQGLYRGIYGIGGAGLLAPLNYANYAWLTPPPTTYADSTGYELFDRRTGDPRNPQDPAWVGVQGTNGVSILRVDLGTSKEIDWVGLHTLTYPSWGIRSPTAMDIYCGSTASTLMKIAAVVAPFTQAALSSTEEEEYLLGNRTPLNKSCRFLELRIQSNGNWLFASELELAVE
jgi:hypothetical protein